MFNRSPAVRLWPAACVLVLLLGVLACERWPDVRWENATSLPVVVYENGHLAFTLEPHESRDVSTNEDVWHPDIKATADDGRVLLEGHITWDKLEEMGFRIVITDPTSPPVGPTGTAPWATPSPEPTTASASPAPVWPTPPPAACWGLGPQSSLGPSAPTNLRAELASSPLALKGQIVSLQWDDNADNELCYVIDRKVGEEDWSVYESDTGNHTGPGAIDDIPQEVGTHCYRVSYGNYEGRSGSSNEACVDVEVVPVVATPTPPITPEPPPGWTPPPSPTPFPWPCNSTDDPPYSELAPSAPTELAAIVERNTGMQLGYWVELYWQAEPSDALCYLEQRLGNDGAWHTVGGHGMGIAMVGADAEPWLGVRCYRVAMANEHGRSAWSNEACATGPAVVLPSTPAASATPTAAYSPTPAR